MAIRIAISALVALVLGCASLPKAPDLRELQLVPGELSEKVVYLPACPDHLPEDASRYCSIRLADTYRALVATELFREVTIGEAPSGRGNLLVDLHDFPRRPYYTTPAHNPGFLLLSLALPFWWTEPLGFRFSIMELPDGQPILVDTRWQGTAVMWSLASLLNVLPGRTFESTFAQDVARLRRALAGEGSSAK